MTAYRRHALTIFFRNHLFSEVWIDPHYEEKHSESINDELILILAQKIHAWSQKLSAESAGFKFYEADGQYKGRFYRIVIVEPADKKYLGVRNAYRRSK